MPAPVATVIPQLCPAPPPACKVTAPLPAAPTTDVEPLVEIETAKSLVELPSPFAGTVQKLMVAEGEMVDVGTPIISIGDGAAPAEPAPAAPADRS